MSMKIISKEGGGYVTDETEEFDSRLEWLEETDGKKSNIWTTLAEGEYSDGSRRKMG